ncbi:hypothetical protein QAD02_001504 [Eretmocerus hayati]|uniref:Uncharacterized protein n=1 Tax=Eretmocerus hayati TaxID=131215 RepID=A0ACC2NL09_9HYME|nr:hypothetical protein QAD02_001504 [Eretmocerus hayati]
MIHRRDAKDEYSPRPLPLRDDRVRREKKVVTVSKEYSINLKKGVRQPYSEQCVGAEAAEVRERMLGQKPIAVRESGETDSEFSFRVHCLAFDNNVAKKHTCYCRDQDSVKDASMCLMDEFDSVIKPPKKRSRKEVHRGVNTSMRYFGAPGSRCEKCWATIDPADYPKLVDCLEKHGKNIKGSALFHQSSVSIDPRLLQTWGIKHPGDFVFIGAGILHAVVNVGFNNAIAMNVVTRADAHNEDICRKYCHGCSEEEIGRKPREFYELQKKVKGRIIFSRKGKHVYPTCNVEFVRKAQFDAHVLKEHDLKIHTCRFNACGISFKTVSSRDSHERRVHKQLDEEVPCTVEGCTKKMRKRNMGRHLRTCHPGE